MKSGKLIILLLIAALVLGAALALIVPRDLDLHLDALKPAPAGPALTDCAISHEPEFGGVYIQSTIDDFNALGFAFGDSVDVTFSNGYTLEDLPYYNGYYTQNGEPLLVGYPGYDFIKAAINSGDDLWTVAGLAETDTAAVTLHEAGKYLNIQNARDLHYSDDRAAFESDAVFANFRSVEAGSIPAGRLYRSASPCDNQHSRAAYVDGLMGDVGVAFILDLADDSGKIEGYLADPAFSCPNFSALYEAGKVVPVALNMNFTSIVFAEKLASGLTAMSEQPGPYLVHCTEGKDRTGFVCMLLEALCGASYQELVDDYMQTYANYYGITQAGDPERYNVIVEQVFDPMLRSMLGDPAADLSAADYPAAAQTFLRNAGMTDEQITALQTHLTQA